MEEQESQGLTPEEIENITTFLKLFEQAINEAIVDGSIKKIPGVNALMEEINKEGFRLYLGPVTLSDFGFSRKVPQSIVEPKSLVKNGQVIRKAWTRKDKKLLEDMGITLGGNNGRISTARP